MNTQAMIALRDTAEDQGLIVETYWNGNYPDVMDVLVIDGVHLYNEDMEYEIEQSIENAQGDEDDRREIGRGRFE